MATAENYIMPDANVYAERLRSELQSGCPEINAARVDGWPVDRKVEYAVAAIADRYQGEEEAVRTADLADAHDSRRIAGIVEIEVDTAGQPDAEARRIAARGHLELATTIARAADVRPLPDVLRRLTRHTLISSELEPIVRDYFRRGGVS